MPKRLLQRCKPDSIHEFRLAARQRYDDGLILSIKGRRIAAIYVWGYAIEMTLKAAYFSFIGKGLQDPITWQGDLQPAIQTARSYAISWPSQGAGHNLLAWAELLIAYRTSRNQTYLSQFRLEIQRNAQQSYQLWRETLRYHKNIAYPFEVRQMENSAQWFLSNDRFL